MAICSGSKNMIIRSHLFLFVCCIFSGLVCGLRVAITGSSGTVGKALVERLRDKEAEVIQISLRDVTRNLEKQLENCDAIVHLAGENVASGDEGQPLAILGRWTESKKVKIFNSRVSGSREVVQAISRLKKKPKVFLSASAIGYYPYDKFDKTFSDDEVANNRGSGFLSNVCLAWEEEALKAQKSGVRTCALRFAPILTTKGGILAKLIPIFSLGIGGNLGSGKQPFSWITLNDAVRAILFLIENPSINGPVNVCATAPVTNAQFTKAMGRAVNRPALIPLPQFVGDTIFGDFGREMLFGGQSVIPTKLVGAGFQFEDQEIDSAIRKLVDSQE